MGLPQWLRLPSSSAGGLGSISDQELRFPYMLCGAAKKALSSLDTMKCNETFLYLVMMKGSKRGGLLPRMLFSLSPMLPLQVPDPLGSFVALWHPSICTSLAHHCQVWRAALFTDLSERLSFYINGP